MSSMIQVLVVDDSAVVRHILSEILQKDKLIRFETASDPIYAKEKMKTRWPDVIILDMEMPRMDGLTFLRQVMSFKPTPIIVCSSLVEAGAEITLEALSLGAFAILEKPTLGVKEFLSETSDKILELIHAAKKSKRHQLITQKITIPQEKHTADVILEPVNSKSMSKTTDRFIAIGISTGGTQALEYLLTNLPRTTLGLVIVQHMPEQYTKAFAERLNRISQMEVKEAVSGERIAQGKAIIAPGGKHLMVKRSGAFYFTEVVDGPLVSRHRPSVDVLFRSVANFAGRNAIGIIMTGMGDDGAKGMKELFNVGAHTIAQDEETCVVFGMPKEAIKLGAIHSVLGLPEILKAIQGFH